MQMGWEYNLGSLRKHLIYDISIIVRIIRKYKNYSPEDFDFFLMISVHIILIIQIINDNYLILR